MRRHAVGILAGVGALAATALPAAAQVRPDTDFSQSSSSSGPICIVGGVASDCGGAASAVPATIGAVPVFVAPSPVTAALPPIGGFFGGSAIGTVAESVDVDESSRAGTVAAR